MFTNRREAGEKLGQALDKYRDRDVLVLGIPRGGAETAYYVARHLHAPLALVISRKLGYPFDPEAAFGAIAEDGSVYISANGKKSLTEREINDVLADQKKEIARRIQTLRHGRPLPGLEGKTVVLVDDGIATGATLFATIELCKNKKAGKIIVAAPIAGKRMESVLKSMVDEVVILEMPAFYHAVSQGYRDFYNLSDEEAVAFVDQWEKDQPIIQE